MNEPALTVTVEPTNLANRLYYQSQAPSFKDGTARIRIIARLRITNNEDKDVRVTGIWFNFPGTDRRAIRMKAVTKAIVPDTPDLTGIQADGWIGKGVTATWANGTVNLTDDEDPEQEHNQVYLSGAIPPTLSIQIKCQDFPTRLKKEFELERFTTPTSEGAFFFPFSVADLNAGEYFEAKGEHGTNGGTGALQIYAHDISLQGTDDGSLSRLRSGIAEAKENSWAGIVRAIDGPVEMWQNSVWDSFWEVVRYAQASQGRRRVRVEFPE